MKPTFKNHYPEGAYRSFGHIYSDIKVGGQQVGVIQYSSKDNAHAVILHVKHEANFRNVTLKKKFPAEYNERGAINEAKKWLKDNWSTIESFYDLHKLS